MGSRHRRHALRRARSVTRPHARGRERFTCSIGRVSKQRLNWTGWRDIGFFLHWEGIAVALGGLALAALEFWDIPEDWPLGHFVDDYRIWLVVFFALMVGLPPTIARGLDHLRARSDAGRAQVEVATVLYGVEIRLMNLVSKLREVFGGHRSNTYQNHTLGDCKAYFTTRAGRSIGEGENCVVEVNYYGLERSRTSISLVRKLFTGAAHVGMRTTFSTARNASKEAKQLVKTILAGEPVFCRDVRDPREAARLHIEDGDKRPYRTFLSIPVLRDKDSPHDERVLGMLSINATHTNVLDASDAAILKVYAWALAAAFEADHLSRNIPRATSTLSAGHASMQTTDMEG